MFLPVVFPLILGRALGAEKAVALAAVLRPVDRQGRVVLVPLVTQRTKGSTYNRIIKQHLVLILVNLARK